MQANLGSVDGYGLSYAATADRQRFLINTLVEFSNPAPMTIVLNSTSDLKH
jgi:hypothetical protein